MKRKAYFHGGYTISVPCFEEALDLQYLLLVWLLISTTEPKSAVSQEYMTNKGHLVVAAWKISQKDKGNASSRQDNSSHFIDGMWLICKAELLPLRNIQRAPFLHKLQLLAPYQSRHVPSERLYLPAAWAAHLCFKGFTPIQKSWSVAL